MYDSPARFDDEIYKYMNLKEVESVSHAIDTFETFFVHKRRFEIIFFNYYNAISKTEDERELYTLFKKFKEEVDSKKKNFTQRSFLHSVGNLIMGFWDPHLGALSRLLNKCLLLNTYRRNALDEKLFIDFLKKPCESCWFEGLNKKQEKQYKGFSSCSYEWMKFVGYYSDKMADGELVSACLDELIVSPEAIKKYKTFFTKEYLEEVYYLNLARKGGSMDKIRELKGTYFASEFQNKVILELTEKNLGYFDKEQPIELKIKLKNIKNLELRAYELDVARYLKEFKTEPPIDIDLDGLVAKNAQKHTYDLPAQMEHIDTFKFPELDSIERGFFIIDIIGDGKMSRAVIKKGTLNLVQLPYKHGYKLFVLDEDKEICRGQNTGIYVGDKFMAIPEDGSEFCVKVPFEKIEKSYDCILQHGNFAMRANYTLESENYTLTGGLIFNEESFISGRMAKILLRLRLNLNKNPVSLNKFKQDSIIITLNTMTYSGQTNTKVFEEINLTDDEDPKIEFLVPNGLSYVNVTFQGAIESVNNPHLELSYSQDFNIHKRNNSDIFYQPFLRQNKKGDKNNYWIELKGRNGEFVEQERLSIYLSRETDKQVETIYADTNKNGVIELGELDNIASIQVEGKFGEQTWQVAAFKTSSLQTKSDFFRICEGEELILPSLEQQLDPNVKQKYQLLRVSSEGYFYSDHSKNIKEGEISQKIILKDLKVGTYTLTYFKKNELLSIGILVQEAKRWKYSQAMIENPFSLTHVTGELNFLNIDRVRVQGQNLEIQTTSNDPKNVVLHIMGHLATPITLGHMESELRSTRSQGQTKKFELNKVTNEFINGRTLGDEMKYVLDRQNLSSKIGNTLEKPSLLLHRKFIRETKDDEEVLKDGEEFNKNKIMLGVKAQKQKEMIQENLNTILDRSSKLDELVMKSTPLNSRNKIFHKSSTKKKGFFGGGGMFA